MTAIAELENRLLDRGKPKVKQISDCAREVMPTDRPFTSEDILEALQALDPTRVWNRWPVTNVLVALRKRGVIYRVRKAKMGQRALYAAKGVKAPVAKLGDASLLDVMQAVAIRPMTVTEVAVAVLEAGYETSMARRTFQNTVGKILRRGRFARCEGGRWRAAG